MCPGSHTILILSRALCYCWPWSVQLISSHLNDFEVPRWMVDELRLVQPFGEGGLEVVVGGAIEHDSRKEIGYKAEKQRLILIHLHQHLTHLIIRLFICLFISSSFTQLFIYSFIYQYNYFFIYLFHLSTY